MDTQYFEQLWHVPFADRDCIQASGYTTTTDTVVTHWPTT